MNSNPVRRGFRLLGWATTIAFLYVSVAAAQATTDVPRARPGDRVVLKVPFDLKVPDIEVMSDTFLVAQNGNVVLPKPVGITRAEGFAISELEDSLRAVYVAYLQDPSVQVIILRRISVLGEVREPGIYLADLTMGIPELVARAGGPTENGDARRITVLRGNERLNFRADRQGLIFTAELHSGDQVVVGRRNFLLRNPWTAISTVFTALTLARQLGIW